MPNEVNLALPQAGTPTDADLEPKMVSKPKFMPTYHRNAYLQTDLLIEDKAA